MAKLLPQKQGLSTKAVTPGSSAKGSRVSPVKGPTNPTNYNSKATGTQLPGAMKSRRMLGGTVKGA